MSPVADVSLNYSPATCSLGMAMSTDTVENMCRQNGEMKTEKPAGSLLALPHTNLDAPDPLTLSAVVREREQRLTKGPERQGGGRNRSGTLDSLAKGGVLLAHELTGGLDPLEGDGGRFTHALFETQGLSMSSSYLHFAGFRPQASSFSTAVDQVAEAQAAHQKQLEEVLVRTQANPPEEVGTSFVYDGDGGRVMKTVTSPSLPDQLTVYIGKHYVCQGPNAQNLGCAKLIFANGQRIAMVEVLPGGGNGAVTYFHPDHLGSTSVVTEVDNGQFQVEQELAYYPFGETRVNTTSNNVDVAYKYTGQELDSSTDLYDYHARLYDPLLGRFISPDPIVQDPFDPQSLNRYSYARNNPLRYTDPTGNAWYDAVVNFFTNIWQSVVSFFSPILQPFIGPATTSIGGLPIGDSIGVPAPQVGKGKLIKELFEFLGDKIRGFFTPKKIPSGPKTPSTTPKPSTPSQLGASPRSGSKTTDASKSQRVDGPTSAAEKLGNLSGLSRTQADKAIRQAGFEHKGTTPGGYVKYRHPDGSRVQIRPNGEVVRTGPKVRNPDPNLPGFRPRIGPDGKPTPSHNTGEIIK